MPGTAIEIRPIDVGEISTQQLLDRHLNGFAVHLLLESVTHSKLLEALPEGVSFTLASIDPRHQGVRISITRHPA